MNNKNLMALIAATTITTSASAGFFLTGDYEGTISDGNPGAATYAQDLDITMVGDIADGTKVTATFENLGADVDGGSTVKSTQVFVETAIEGLDFKGGNFKSQNGSGLMQTTSAVTNQMQVGFDVAGSGVTVGQVSGVGKATVDTSLTVAGLTVKAQNVTDTTRFVTISTTIAGLEVTAETQKTVTGRNTAGSVGTTVAGVNVTGVMVDVEDTAVVTQDDGILGDISGAVDGKTVKGVVASTSTTLGLVTGKYINMNELDTYVAEVERGVWTFGYAKTENADGITTGKINVAF